MTAGEGMIEKKGCSLDKEYSRAEIDKFMDSSLRLSFLLATL